MCIFTHLLTSTYAIIFLLYISLPNPPNSIEWLKLWLSLTTIPMPQPMTSNPQPKTYNIFLTIHFFSLVRLISRYVSIQESRAFRKASLMMLTKQKNPEMRYFSSFIYLFLTANTPSPREYKFKSYPHIITKILAISIQY